MYTSSDRPARLIRRARCGLEQATRSRVSKFEIFLDAWADCTNCVRTTDANLVSDEAKLVGMNHTNQFG